MRRLLTLGGTSGIGEEAHSYLSGLARPEAPSRPMYHETKSFGHKDFDIVDYNGWLRALLGNFRPTDVVYSIGINKLDWIKDVSLSDFGRLMDVNVWGFVKLIQYLDQANLGPVNVVAITSDAAWRPMRTSVAYCASKAALEMAVRVASREYAPRGWRINAVAPGKVEDTPMTDYVDQRVHELRGWSVEEAEQYELASTPLGRKVSKREVAEVIAQVLFGPAAQTGEIIAVNGGR